MMEIYVGGKLAALKEGTSFEYVSENRLFTGSDGYTLSISFPLADCPQNLAIFGNVNRADVALRKVVFDCDIRDGAFRKSGSVTVTEISEAEVKCQFLEGRSEQNFDKTFDKVYINALDLGSPGKVMVSSITPAEAWDPDTTGYEAVALPWVNNASDSGLLHNCAEYENGAYSWSEDTKYISWQPYLLYIARKICEAVGYTCDFSSWEAHPSLSKLLVCNCLPSAWGVDAYARALPHWSVEEFFSKLETFLFGEVDIDHRAKHICFSFSTDLLAQAGTVSLDRVVDAHTVTVEAEDPRCDYIEARNIVYREPSYSLWKFLSCHWLVSSWWGLNAVRYDTLSELISSNISLRKWVQEHRGGNLQKLLYAADVDTYFCIRAVSYEKVREVLGMPIYEYTGILQPVNVFDGRIVDEDDDAEQLEVEFVPACIDTTEDKYGRCLTLDFGGFSEDKEGRSDRSYDSDPGWDDFHPTTIESIIKAGKQDEKAEYYSGIFVGFWDGTLPTDGKLPHPIVSDIEVADDWSGYKVHPYSLRLDGSSSILSSIVHHIDPRVKYEFRFLSDSLPDVRALFLIDGKRYVCEKLTATFSVRGMSQLIKGVFYPLAD